MKKLMIAAAIVCAAAMSQAATVSWNLTNVKEGGEGVSGKMYVIADSNFSRDAMLALAGEGATKVSAALSDATHYAFPWTVTGGTGTLAKGATGQPTVAQLGVSEGVAYDFYAVIFDTSDIKDTSNFYVTALKTGQMMATGTGDKNIYFGTQATPSAADGAWHAVGAIPEPTSGLLLLLGVAGLALRRRRA